MNRTEARYAENVLNLARKLKKDKIDLKPTQYELVYLYLHPEKIAVPKHAADDFMHGNVKFVKIRSFK